MQIVVNLTDKQVTWLMKTASDSQSMMSPMSVHSIIDTAIQELMDSGRNLPLEMSENYRVFLKGAKVDGKG